MSHTFTATEQEQIRTAIATCSDLTGIAYSASFADSLVRLHAANDATLNKRAFA